MGRLDICTKDYVEDNNVFADVFNFFLYEGEQRIRPEMLMSVDTAEVTIPYNEDGNNVPSQKFRHKMKILSAKKDMSAVYLILGMENQSEIHYAMPVKCMVYDAFQYASQVEKTARDHRGERRKVKEKITSGEFMSGFYKEDRLIPVITLVIYFGTDEWDGPRTLQQMYMMQNEKLLPFMPDYKINLLVPQEMSDEEIERFQTDFREVMLFCKYMKDREKLQEIIDTDPAYRNMERSAARVIEAAAKIELKNEENEEKINVCEGIQGMIDDAVEEERKRMCEGIQGMIDDAVEEERKRMCEGIQGMIDDAVEAERKRSESKFEEEKKKVYMLIVELRKKGRDDEIEKVLLNKEYCQLLLKEYGMS